MSLHRLGPPRPCTYPPVTVTRSRSKFWSPTASCHGWIQRRRQQRRRQPHILTRSLHTSPSLSIAVKEIQPSPVNLVRSASCTTTIHSPGSLFRHTVATISSLTTSIRSSPTPSSRPSTHLTHTVPPSTCPPPPVFHTQSLLFLFGFLFLPCWWIGAFWTPRAISPEPGCAAVTDEEADMPSFIVVHPSMFANGRAVSRVLLSTAPPLKKHSHQHDQWLALERENHMYRRWNRIMSVASIGILATVIAMLAWYQLGCRR